MRAGRATKSALRSLISNQNAVASVTSATKPERDFDSKYRNIAFWAIAVLTVVGSAMLVAPFFPAIMWAVVFTVLMAPLRSPPRQQ